MGAVAVAVSDKRGGLWRSRWAAIGAAVAVTFGGGGMFAVQAASSEPSSVVTIDPVRILDTRDPNNIGLDGPFVSVVSQKLQVTGTAVPAGATGVLLNVTVVSPTANGFLSVRPGDAVGAATTSSLNFNAGDIVPNSVQVGLPTAGAFAGQIDITYDAFGVAGPTTEVLIDVVGYMAPAGEIVMTHGPGAYGNPNGNVQVFGNRTENTTGTNFANLPLNGPSQHGGEEYGLKSVTYCIDVIAPPTMITRVDVDGSTGGATGQTTVTAFDNTDRSTDGCFTIEVNDKTSTSFTIAWTFAGGPGGKLNLVSVTSTWAQKSAITTTSPLLGPAPEDGN
jgi:hypothetical protein